MVRAIDTFCFIPVESFSIRASAYLPMPNRAMSWSRRGRTWFSGRPLMRANSSSVSLAVSRG